ncbi:hypothetical protein [Pontibacter amylolyticus]|uniref:DUF4393 domain-containing protein n=1 Tax=Pontibacter amylolyticus TaxID=1424080 RepID=A0ABQ1W7Y8_9BACT|nr:hypothetical protein [Pontibacter amylolyticus]GGG19035.1 hypothetical protein GCM10011323_23960 [Pontibacter amylolyticus]
MKHSIHKKDRRLAVMQNYFSDIPNIGNTLDLVAFADRSQIKKNRISDFADLLKDESDYNTKLINLDTLQTEEFSDLFESVLMRVVQSSSKEKHRRFRDILINQMLCPNINVDSAEIYLDLISSLSEAEITILHHFNLFYIKLKPIKQNLVRHNNKLEQLRERLEPERELKAAGYANNYLSLIAEIDGVNNLIASENEKITSGRHRLEAPYYNITEDQFLYFKQRLFSRGLLVDTGIGGIGVEPFEYMSITQFGREFMEYIIR